MIIGEATKQIERLQFDQAVAGELGDLATVSTISNQLDELITEDYLDQVQRLAQVTADSSIHDLYRLGYEPITPEIGEALMLRAQLIAEEASRRRYGSGEMEFTEQKIYEQRHNS